MTFEGFEPANTTPVPDILFDELLSELSGSELKAMLYIIRRTLGFKKTADAISLNQFEKGITTKEGKVLDKGCGIKDRHTLLRVLKSLEQKWNCIISEKVVNEKGECETTLYRIKFRTNGVEEKSTLPVQSGSGKNHTTLEEKSTLPTGGKSTLPVVGKITLTRNSNTRDRLQETVKQEENNSEQTDTPAFVAHATLPPVEFDEEQRATLRALQAGLIGSGVLPEPLPIATPTPDQPMGNNAAVQASPPSPEQAAMVELSPPIVDKSQANGDKPSKVKKPVEPPVMPSEDAPWCAETLVEILEARRGSRFPNGARNPKDRIRDKALRDGRTIVDMDDVDRVAFIFSVDRLETRKNGWWLDNVGHVFPYHMLKDDKIHTMMDELKRQYGPSWKDVLLKKTRTVPAPGTPEAKRPQLGILRPMPTREELRKEAF